MPGLGNTNKDSVVVLRVKVEAKTGLARGTLGGRVEVEETERTAPSLTSVSLKCPCWLVAGLPWPIPPLCCEVKVLSGFLPWVQQRDPAPPPATLLLLPPLQPLLPQPPLDHPPLHSLLRLVQVEGREGEWKEKYGVNREKYIYITHQDKSSLHLQATHHHVLPLAWRLPPHRGPQSLHSAPHSALRSATRVHRHTDSTCYPDHSSQT
ncbi:hypothetical protein E2C01_025159 [Portunus trituberculatus]|uniref:Uncharacterized protein n=1 Tax=Portunus trituberculatus TaxID=210409 RepID=A0A5B7EEZ5_PORTR|nr:hypothetical protein [Portunus trituberculatus]